MKRLSSRAVFVQLLRCGDPFKPEKLLPGVGGQPGLRTHTLQMRSEGGHRLDITTWHANNGIPSRVAAIACTTTYLALTCLPLQKTETLNSNPGCPRCPFFFARLFRALLVFSFCFCSCTVRFPFHALPLPLLLISEACGPSTRAV
jgi:hypothetical protein